MFETKENAEYEYVHTALARFPKELARLFLSGGGLQPGEVGASLGGQDGGNAGDSFLIAHLELNRQYDFKKNHRFNLVEAFEDCRLKKKHNSKRA